ncbi:phage holin family protein [Luteococcus sp. OSA5]|uniref:phage holin family protein n=1 Tax=Luteococcus sp. OSA5 TaxID=3401630 RepID=UPI003B42CBE2
MSGAHIPQTAHQDDDRSIGQIVADLSQNFSTLVRQELDLAKAELKQDATRAGSGAGMLAGAGITAHLALTFASLALWWTLAIWIGNHDHPALGWSGLILAVLWGIVAAALAATGRKKMQQIDGLPRTTETTKKIPDALKGNEERNR